MPAKNSNLIVYAAAGDDPLREPWSAGGQLDLTRLTPADGATATWGSVSPDLSRAGPGPLGTVSIPAELATFHHCRVRLGLKVDRGEIVSDVRTPGGNTLLAVLPKLSSRDQLRELDFNVPVDDAVLAKGSDLSLTLYTAVPAGAAVTLRSVHMYGCEK
jgi:hypothetical protein